MAQQTRRTTTRRSTTDSQPPPSSTTEQAEQIVDRATKTVGNFLSKAFARAREEAEDIWAEADHVRRGGRPRGR